jgi:hypothetical protein
MYIYLYLLTSFFSQLIFVVGGGGCENSIVPPAVPLYHIITGGFDDIMAEFVCSMIDDDDKLFLNKTNKKYESTLRGV